ncbi:tyrosine-type recombinase/integrase [Amycolatopsis japonica]
MAWAEKMPSGRWRGCWRDTAKRKKSITNEGRGYDRKTDAKEAAQEQEVKARRQAAVASGTQSAKIHWKELWEIFNNRPRRKNAVSNTVANQQTVVDLYVMDRWGDIPINKISHGQVQLWIDEDIALPGRKASYVQTIYKPFRSSMNYAVKKLKILDASPCVGVELPQVRKNRRKAHATTADTDSLAKKLSPPFRRLMDFEHDTGVRPNEACGIHADQLDFKRRRAQITNVFVEGVNVIRAYPKDDDPRDVPLTDRAMAAAKEALEGRDLTAGCGVPHADGSRCRSVLVFLSPRGLPVTPKNYYLALWRAGKKAGTENRGPYTMRRGFSTRAVENGVDPFTLKEILGHEKLDQTSEYVQLTETALSQFVAKMGDHVQLKVVGQQEGHGAESGANTQGTPLDEHGREKVEDAG